MNTTEITNKEKKGWSWLGFLFAPYYYAGYGNLQKGLIFAVLSGITPIFGLIIAIYGGIKAKRELQIKERDFNWKYVVLAVFVLLAVAITLEIAIPIIQLEFNGRV